MLIQSDKAEVIVKTIVPSLLAGKLLDKPKALRDTVFESTQEEREARTEAFTMPEGVVLVDISGTLLHKSMWFSSGATSYQSIQNTVLREAEAGTKTFCFYMDSPGGEVSGLFALTEALKAYREMYDLTYVGVVDSLAASACYAVASVCDTLYATADSEVLSIGAIMVHVSETSKDKKEGYDYTFLRSKPEKAKGSSHEKLDGETKKKWRNELQKIDNTFNMLVTSEREVDLKTVIATKGNTMSALEAKELGFIDHVIPYLDSDLIDFGDASQDDTLAALTTNLSKDKDMPKTKTYTTEEVQTQIDAAVLEAGKTATESASKAFNDGATQASAIFTLAEEMGLPSKMAHDQISAGHSLETAKSIFAYAASLQEEVIHNDTDGTQLDDLAGATTSRIPLVGDTDA